MQPEAKREGRKREKINTADKTEISRVVAALSFPRLLKEFRYRFREIVKEESNNSFVHSTNRANPSPNYQERERECRVSRL